jgi:hypothetical protein
MKGLYYLFILLLLLPLSGCAGNIKNISADISPKESILVGYIKTVPVLWEFSLYEEKSKAEDQIDIGGKEYGFTEASKLQHQGYLFKIARPGSYTLRLHKKNENGAGYDNILHFEVPEGKLVYFGTVRVVIDNVAPPSFQGDRTPHSFSVKFKYHFEVIDEDETLKHFADRYPQVYSVYEDMIMRVPSPAQPQYLTFFPRTILYH